MKETYHDPDEPSIGSISTFSSEEPDISTDWLERVLDKLKGQGVKYKTRRKYHSIFTRFLKFVAKLTRKPDAWEDKMNLYATFLKEKTRKSNTLTSYMSAIRHILVTDGVVLDNDRLATQAIVKACKLQNDWRTVTTRMPINKHLLRSILLQVDEHFETQPYLCALYKAMFNSAYHGLMRVGEITSGDHPVLACDVLVAENKRKVTYVLRSSKTHDWGDPPQIINFSCECKEPHGHDKFCPYQSVLNYMLIKERYATDNEPFFVYQDRSPVKPEHFRHQLKQIMLEAGIKCESYNTHSFRIGKADDLKLQGKSLEFIQMMGRWKSNNVIFNYFRS